ncbi:MULTISPECIES: hypothetical protein [unclassified Wolbachia]|nr:MULTISPECIES: hypothetical protein [unclassified Wolbachia]
MSSTGMTRRGYLDDKKEALALGWKAGFQTGMTPLLVKITFIS